MLALVVIDQKSVRESAARILQAAEHRVEQTDSKGALGLLDRLRLEVLVIGWSPGAAALVRRLRSLDTGRQCLVLAVLEQQPSSEIPAVYAAGVDDFMRAPVSKEELVGRLEALRRRTHSEAGAAQDWSDGVDLQKLQVWGELGNLVAEDLSQLSGPLDVCEVAALEGSLHIGSITLSLASDETEMRVSVAVEPSRVQSLGALLLGDESPSRAALDDMLRELANTAGGAVKRAALLEHVTATTGLPVNETRTIPAGEGRRCWLATIRGTNVRMGFVGEVLRRANQRVAAAELREGMVLAHDLHNHHGALVMAGGTRLTATSAGRVASLLGEHYLVEVALAA